MITGVALAHVAMCVPDVEAAVRWYADVLGCEVLSPPYRMEGDAIERDMGELVPPPVVVKAAIVGFESSDHVLELIEYPAAEVAADRSPTILRHGVTHLGLVCDDLDATRQQLQAAGVEFLTSGVASVAGLRTTWFRDPWATVFILMEKSSPPKPYWHQY